MWTLPTNIDCLYSKHNAPKTSSRHATKIVFADLVLSDSNKKRRGSILSFPHLPRTRFLFYNPDGIAKTLYRHNAPIEDRVTLRHLRGQKSCAVRRPFSS